jgi:hypothetical protein
MTVNIARFEESSEIVLDSETIAAEVNVTLSYASVMRVGALVAVHIEGSYVGPTVAQLSAALSTGGGAITELPVDELEAAVAAGSYVTTDGVHTQTWVTTGAAKSATEIPVTSQTPTFDFPVGQDVVSAAEAEFATAQLPAAFAPGATVTPVFSGDLTAVSIDADGVLHVTPNATAGAFVIDATYAAGVATP